MEAILFVAAIVGVVWTMVYCARGPLLAGCIAFIVVGACFGHPFFHIDFPVMPLTFDRAVLAVLLIAFALQTRAGGTEPKPLTRTDVGLFVFVGMLAISGAVNGFYGGPDEKYAPAWRLLGGYLFPLAIYWIARQTRLDGKQLSLVQGVLAVLGVYLGVTGILEVTRQWWAVFPSHIADPELGIHFGRARGPMVHSVTYGLHLGICLLATWLWGWRFGRVGKLILILLTVPMMAGLAFSYTRSVWMGFGLAVAVLAAAGTRGLVRVWLLGSMVALALVAVAGRSDSLLAFQREDSAADTAKSVSMRGSFTYVSWKMFCDRPVFGFGFGQFPEAKLPYLDDRSTELDLEAIRPYVHHNTLLSLLTETGLVGLSLFVLVLIGWARTGLSLAQSPGEAPWSKSLGLLMLGALAVYLCQALFHELSYTPMDHSLLFLIAGLTMNERCRTKSTIAVGPRRASDWAALAMTAPGVASCPNIPTGPAIR